MVKPPALHARAPPNLGVATLGFVLSAVGMVFAFIFLAYVMIALPIWMVSDWIKEVRRKPPQGL